MADMAATKEAVREWAQRLVEEVRDVTLARLDDTVPRAANHDETRGVRLADTRVVQDRPLGFSIEYPGDLPNILDRGSRPHIIRARRANVLVFAWDDGPAALRGRDGFYRFEHVNHPGSTLHVGWWTEPTSPAALEGALQQAIAVVPFPSR